MTDLKNILHEVVEDINDDDNDIDLKNNPNVKVHKKPIQLTEIEKRSKSNNVYGTVKTENEINKMIDMEKQKLYNQLWTRLDTGCKINRLKYFVENNLKEEFSLTEKEIEKCSKLLSNACSKNKLTKSSDVIYDKEEGIIKNIKILNFDEEKRIFTLKFPETKSKGKNKSKSNIERFLK